MALTHTNNVQIGQLPKLLANWLKAKHIEFKLVSAKRDADVLRAQIKNDSQALAYIQRQQAILSSELQSIK